MKKNVCTISVIVPVYNAEAYIEECLESLVEQDIGLETIEVIIVDDCTPDNSISIAQMYVNKYPNSFRIIRHNTNKGLGAARNTGIEYATGQYIAFLDSDDFLDTNVFSLALATMENDRNIDIFLYAYEYFSESNKQYPLNPSGKLFPLNKTISQYEIVQNPEIFHAFSACNKVYRTTLIKKVTKFSTGHFEDMLFAIEGFLKLRKIHITDKTTYFYRKRESSNASIMDDMLLRKGNFFDHLSRNESIYYFAEQYPHLCYTLNWINVRTWSAFLYNIFDDKTLFSDKEKEMLFQRTKNIYQFIDSNNLYNDGVRDKNKKYIKAVQASDTFSEAYKVLNNHSKVTTQIKAKAPASRTKALAKKVIPNRLHPILAKVKRVIFSTKPAKKPKVQKIELPSLSSKEQAIKAEIETLLCSNDYLQLPKDIWLFSERGDEAKDNAYALFKYMRTNHPKVPAFFILTQEDSNIYREVKNLGNVIDKNSVLHKLLFLKSKYLLCTHARGMISPWPIPTVNKVYPEYREKKYIFLQHGITQNNVSSVLGKKSQNFDMFICGAKPEYDYILKNFGYDEQIVKYTGFSRFDALHNIKTKNRILLMPTWRASICQPSWVTHRTKNDSIFIKSEYYKKYQDLLHSQDLVTMLEKNNIELIFYPHYEVQQYLKYFTSPSDKIIIADKDSYDVQALLKESKLLITDYSSVFFDFGYMQKPTLYYQFDEKEFFDSHYKRGYFNYKVDGFGVVCNYQERLLKEIKSIISSDFKVQKKYQKRIDKFFPLHDTKNCERIYDEITLDNRNNER